MEKSIIITIVYYIKMNTFAIIKCIDWNSLFKCGSIEIRPKTCKCTSKLKYDQFQPHTKLASKCGLLLSNRQLVSCFFTIFLFRLKYAWHTYHSQEVQIEKLWRRHLRRPYFLHQFIAEKKQFNISFCFYHCSRAMSQSFFPLFFRAFAFTALFWNLTQ